MSRSKFDRLIDQFYEREGNPRAQQVLLRQIVRMRDPQAIPELLAIYRRKDVPASLRRIAGQGLRDFWLLNQRVSEGTGKLRAVAIEPWLRRARPVLAAILVVTLVINVAILIARAIPAPTQNTPSSVASLGDLYKQQITDGYKTGHNLRLRWQEVQSQSKINCGAVSITPISPVTAAPIDLTTYAGVAPLNAELNDALTQFAASQASLNTICAAAGNATTIAAASGDRGAAGQIVLVDAALTKLDAAQADLDRWLAAPLPSATPSPIPATSTATALPSATSLPPTAGPSPTSTWTPLPSATVTATTIPISPTTLPNTLIPSATALSTTQLTGLGLASLHSYSYVLTVISTGTRSGQPINRSLTVKALRLATPLTDKAQAQYTIGLTEDVPWLQPLDLLYQPGQVEHVLLNGSYYFDTLQPPGIACQVVPSTNRAAPLEAIDPNAFLKPLFGVTLTRTGQDEIVSGLAAHHYHAEQTVGVAPNATTLIYDVFISTDARQLPLRVVYSVNGAVTNALIGLTNAPIPKTDQVISYSASFTLAQIDPTLTIQPPTECPAK